MTDREHEREDALWIRRRRRRFLVGWVALLLSLLAAATLLLATGRVFLGILVGIVPVLLLAGAVLSFLGYAPPFAPSDRQSTQALREADRKAWEEERRRGAEGGEIRAPPEGGGPPRRSPPR